MKLKSRFWQVVLEINNISFKYFLGMYLVLLFLESLRAGLISARLHFSLNFLLGFVAVSGLAKLFFQLDELIEWIKRHPFQQAEKVLKVLLFLKKIRRGFSQIVSLARSLFYSSLILYLSLLFLTDEFSRMKSVNQALFSIRGPLSWLLHPEANKLNFLFWFVIITGFIFALGNSLLESLGEKPKKKIEHPGPKIEDYFWAGFLAVVGGLFVFYKTSPPRGEFGGLARNISLLSGLVIFLLSVIILNENQERKIQKINEVRKLPKNK